MRCVYILYRYGIELVMNGLRHATAYTFWFRSESLIINLIITQINFITLASVEHFLVMRSRVQLFAFVLFVYEWVNVLLFKHRYAAITLSHCCCLLFQLPFSVCVMDCDSTHRGRKRIYLCRHSAVYINHVRCLKSDPVTVLTSAQSHSFDSKRYRWWTRGAWCLSFEPTALRFCEVDIDSSKNFKNFNRLNA